MNEATVKVMKGVVKPDILLAEMRKLRDGDLNARSYCRGALQYLERRPPNRFIVPVLQTALGIKS